MSPSFTAAVHGGQHDNKQVTFESLGIAFVADEILGFVTLDPARKKKRMTCLLPQMHPSGVSRLSSITCRHFLGVFLGVFLVRTGVPGGLVGCPRAY